MSFLQEQQWGSGLKPSDLESNAISTWQFADVSFTQRSQHLSSIFSVVMLIGYNKPFKAYSNEITCIAYYYTSSATHKLTKSAKHFH